jgi:hypothetical protein
LQIYLSKEVKLRIVSSIPTPGSERYNVVCYCGFPFSTAGDNRGMVKCPQCKREAPLRELVKAFLATPTEKLARLKDIAVEARSLFTRWDVLPELEKTGPEGKKLTAKLEEYYKEAQAIMAEINGVAK